MRRIVLTVLVAASLAATCAQSNIELIKDSDPFTDADRSRVVVHSEDKPRFGGANAIVWRCDGDRDYELFVRSEEYLGGDRIPVIYRFDDVDAVTGSWSESTSGTAAFANTWQRDAFTWMAVEAERVVIGLTDYRGQRHEYRFRLDGLRPNLEALGCVQEPTPVIAPSRVEPSLPEAVPPASSSVVPPPPLRETRPRPLAVILDNELGYPQAGLPQASWIAEMPVEGGATRLMAFFDAGEPARVGPIRGARDYFVEVAAGADAVLVHDGGSPSALIALDQGMAPSMNADRQGELFEHAVDRSAPYDLYSTGAALRAALRSMNIDAQRLLTGFRPVAPTEEVPRAGGVAIDWSGAYDSGFRYVDAADRYRWIRNGDDAVSASGTAVQVEAVLIASIAARPVPNDAAGRLYIPVSGGEALLLWRGAVMEGTWSVDGGLRFADVGGSVVSLEALVTWAAFVPQGATVELR